MILSSPGSESSSFAADFDNSIRISIVPEGIETPSPQICAKRRLQAALAAPYPLKTQTHRAVSEDLIVAQCRDAALSSERTGGIFVVRRLVKRGA